MILKTIVTQILNTHVIAVIFGNNSMCMCSLINVLKYVRSIRSTEDDFCFLNISHRIIEDVDILAFSCISYTIGSIVLVIGTIRRNSGHQSYRKSTHFGDANFAVVRFANIQWLASSLIFRTYHATPRRTMYLLCSWMAQLQLTILTRKLNCKKGKYLISTMNWNLPLISGVSDL